MDEIIYIDIDNVINQITSKERYDDVDIYAMLRMKQLKELPKNVLTVDFLNRLVYYRK